jgi:hypothetical protein
MRSNHCSTRREDNELEELEGVWSGAMLLLSPQQSRKCTQEVYKVADASAGFILAFVMVLSQLCTVVVRNAEKYWVTVVLRLLLSSRTPYGCTGTVLYKRYSEYRTSTCTAGLPERWMYVYYLYCQYW